MWQIRRYDGVIVERGSDDEDAPSYPEDAYSFERLPERPPESSSRWLIFGIVFAVLYFAGMLFFAWE